MRRLACLLLLASGLLSACGDGEAPLNNAQAAEVIENISEVREPPPKGPPAPALIEIAAADIQRELQPGAGCDFSEGGRLLFATVSGDSFARVNGLPVHLPASGPVGPTGGFFASERFSLSIGRLADAGPATGETTSWPARLVLTDRRTDGNPVLRLQGDWRCGA